MLLSLFAAFVLSGISPSILNTERESVVCGVAFNVSAQAFEIKSVLDPGCAHFIASRRAGETLFVGSLIVLEGKAITALAQTPSNFTASENESVRFTRPTPTNDSKSLYSVVPIRVIRVFKVESAGGHITAAEHLRRVRRLQPTSNVTEQEVVELQRCVDALRQLEKKTILFSGCEKYRRRSDLPSRAVALLKSARPISVQ